MHKLNLFSKVGLIVFIFFLSSCGKDSSLRTIYYSEVGDSTLLSIDTIFKANNTLTDSIIKSKVNYVPDRIEKHLYSARNSLGLDYFNIALTLLIGLCIIVLIAFIYFEISKRKQKEFYNHKADVFDENNSLLNAIYDLSISILKYNLIGIIGIALLVILTLILASFVFDLFKNTLNDLIRYQSSNTVLASLLIFLRTSLLGTFILSLMIYIYKFTNSAFDQAVRFNKRKHASIFLIDLYKKFNINENNLDEKKLEAIIKAYKEWNVNIESAFTPHNLKEKESSKQSKFDDLVIDLIKEKFKNEEK